MRAVAPLLLVLITSATAIAADIDAKLRTRPTGAASAVLLMDADTGKTVFARNADQALPMASLTKLFVSAAGLVHLGNDYEFRRASTPIARRSMGPSAVSTSSVEAIRASTNTSPRNNRTASSKPGPRA